MDVSNRMRKNHKHSIYHSWWQVAGALFFVVAPFVFFLLFAHISKLAQGKLFTDILVSTGRLFIAYAIAVVLGWACAMLFYRGRRAAIALPLFDVLQSFPTFAALPLATLAWGQSNITVILFLVITIIWPIFFSTVSSLRLIRTDYHEVVQISQLKGFSYFWHFLVPASLPGVTTGTVIGLGEGWEALVATEIIVKVKGGLGGFFEKYTSDPAITIFGILGLLLLIFSINRLVWMPLLEWSHKKAEG